MKQKDILTIWTKLGEDCARVYLKKSEIESIEVKVKKVGNPDYDPADSQTSEPGKVDAYFLEVRTKSGNVIADCTGYFEKDDVDATVADAFDIK